MKCVIFVDDMGELDVHGCGSRNCGKNSEKGNIPIKKLRISSCSIPPVTLQDWGLDAPL